MGDIRTVTDATFEAEVLKNPKPVLVDFWAPWCGPCLQLSPILESIYAEYGDKLDMVKMNTDDEPQTAARYGVRGLPTLAVYKDGEQVLSKTGAKPKTLLLKDLADFIA